MILDKNLSTLAESSEWAELRFHAVAEHTKAHAGFFIWDLNLIEIDRLSTHPHHRNSLRPLFIVSAATLCMYVDLRAPPVMNFFVNVFIYSFILLHVASQIYIDELDLDTPLPQWSEKIK